MKSKSGSFKFWDIKNIKRSEDKVIKDQNIEILTFKYRRVVFAVEGKEFDTELDSASQNDTVKLLTIVEVIWTKEINLCNNFHSQLMWVVVKNEYRGSSIDNKVAYERFKKWETKNRDWVFKIKLHLERWNITVA